MPSGTLQRSLVRTGERTSKFQDQIRILDYFSIFFFLVVFLCLAARGSTEPREDGAAHPMAITDVRPYRELPHACVWTRTSRQGVCRGCLCMCTPVLAHILRYIYVKKNIYIPHEAQSYRSLHHACIHPHTYTH